ncbi:hypothetical protein FACS1894190_16730 [Spirochaetia bacterium]|nr:hypothetical protein FACS1894190_16730 [Spirochaetia bacterium]GHV22751.1 hypothetical protein FACS189494_10000 [Spirochaetia bacterium]
MKTDNIYILIRCIDCEQKTCRVTCKQTAIAFVHGDVLVERGKCGECGMATKGAIPECVENCKHGTEKAILTIADAEEKRSKAAYALSLLY